MERVVDSRDRLGECPLWDGAALWWVDIHGRAVKRLTGTKLEAFPAPEPVGSIAFLRKGGVLRAMQSGIDDLAKNPQPEHRFNDGRCDRSGRYFWVGTLKDPEFTPTGRLYRLSADGELKLFREGIKVPNSICWSPDGGTMYFADSPRHKIWAFDYREGEIAAERVFAAPHPGFPDGSCVDADGCLWNAEYGAGRVVRYTPAGKVDRVIALPAKNPTCCCFGGSALDTLYVTTAGGEGVFAARPGAKGLPEPRFG